MGLSAALSSALSGIHATEKNLDLVARNIANAETPGYSRKVANRDSIIAGDESIGVRVASITRELDSLLQAQLRDANGTLSGSEIINKALEQLDLLMGEPGGPFALDTLFNDFSQSLQSLVSQPESTAARQQVLTTAQTLVQQFNTMTEQIQRLRNESDKSLASIVGEANDALQQIETINNQIISSTVNGVPPADLLDQRDAQIDRLSKFMDIDVLDRGRGEVSVFTKSGVSLFDGRASELSFDTRGTLTADSAYSTNPAQRSVGTIIVTSPLSNNSVDMLQPGILRSGAIHAHAQLRDDVLVEAQAQLDEIAAALALTFSQVGTDGTAVTAGAQAGFDLDLNALQSGNSVSITTTVSGTEQTFTFVRVDDASQLPLPSDATASPNDTVVGIDFSGGIPAAIAAINTALGADVTASDQGGGVMRVLDDGAAGLSDVNAASTSVTETGLASGNMQLPLFTVANGQPPYYTGSFDGGSQKVGFAGSIAVNPDIMSDPSALVSYAAGVGLGDPARPDFLADRLNQATLPFSAAAGIGVAGAPFNGTIGDYLQRVVDYQASQKSAAQVNYDASALRQEALASKTAETSGVNIDRELSDLLVLQNAYAANARVMSSVNEMMQMLLQV